LVDGSYDGTIPVRRYLCLLCKRTVSLLPELVLPYLRCSIQVIGLFLVSRLLCGRTLREAAGAAFQPNMPYQRGQFWVRRFQRQATKRRVGSRRIVSCWPNCACTCWAGRVSCCRTATVSSCRRLPPRLEVNTQHLS
jgi:hypothetical protein